MKGDRENTAERGRDLEKLLCEPVDELDRELEQMACEIVEQGGDKTAEVCTGRFRRQTIEDGRLMAVLSYFSVIFGIPVFVVPMIQRENEFALHHAKAAGLIFVACTFMLTLALTNCAVFLPLVFVCYIPALIGLYRAAGGAAAGTAALGPTAQRIFHRIEVRE